MNNKNKMLAVILIRGTVNLSYDVKKTLSLLRLGRKNACVVIPDNNVNRGMVQRVKDFVAYGTIEEEFFAKMLSKRAQFVNKNNSSKVDTNKIAEEYFSEKIRVKELEMLGIKPFIRLHPPIGGFERKGIKSPYAKGGALGDRKEEIKELIEKML